MKLDLLYEDEFLVAINKPAGMLSIPDRFDTMLPSLSGLLKQRYGSIFIIHRLDRETSGVILFAKDADTHRMMNEQFESHETRKQYFAVVEGIIPNDHDSITLPISPDNRRLGAMRIDQTRGKESRTDFTVVKRFKHFSSVDIVLHTGRQHQIRVHFSAIGHPVVGDSLYGKTKEFFLSSLKKNYKSHGPEKPLIARTALHAEQLSFKHPAKNDPMTISAPLPKDISALINQLEKWGD